MAKKRGKTQADIDWENRKLCSDESCIGTIGPDGKCKECGLAFGSKVPDETPLDPIEEIDEAEDDEDFETDTEGSGDDLDWGNRTLCRDESCIGVIGPDGKCKECGLARE